VLQSTSLIEVIIQLDPQKKGRKLLIKKIIITIMLIFLFLLLTGCTSHSSNSNFTYSYELNSIEEGDKDEVQKWLNEPSQTPTRTYEVNDEINDRHYLYAHSKIYSDISVQQEGDKIILIFTSKMNTGESQEALVKIKYNPKKINSFVLKTD